MAAVAAGLRVSFHVIDALQGLARREQRHTEEQTALEALERERLAEQRGRERDE